MNPVEYILREKETGKVVRMQDGRPFRYTTEQLAEIARKVLVKHLKIVLYITEG